MSNNKLTMEDYVKSLKDKPIKPCCKKEIQEYSQALRSICIGKGIIHITYEDDIMKLEKENE